MLYLKSLLFLLLAPGTVTVGIPYLLLHSGIGQFDIGAIRFLGSLLIAPGATVLLWCVWDFARIGRGTLAPIDPPKVFVTQGPYRFVRNPMYVGALSILLGEMLLFQSSLLLGWAIFMGLVVHIFVVFYEEPVLLRKFGDSYDSYRRSVPRWIPRLRGRSS